MSPIDSLALLCTELTVADLIKPGVYVLLRDGAVEYIGESSNVLARVGMHSRAFAFDRILYLAEESKRMRRAIEGALARRFNPTQCSIFSRRDQDRDEEILARFGLEIDAENARIIAERAASCWSTEARANAANASRESALARKKEKKYFAKLGIAWSKSWWTRGRRLSARHLWNAVKPYLESETKTS